MKEYISFEKIIDGIKGLKLPKFSKVIVMTRGGLFVAGLLSQVIDCRYFETVCMTSYFDKKQKELKVIKIQEDDSSDILLVEDIIDTGETIKKAKQFYPNAKVFALHYKEKGGLKPDYYLWITDKWVVYPWEFNEL